MCRFFKNNDEFKNGTFKTSLLAVYKIKRRIHAEGRVSNEVGLQEFNL